MAAVLGNYIEPAGLELGSVGRGQSWTTPGQNILELSDGTLIFVAAKAAAPTVLVFWYSTDDGASWTECATTTNTGANAIRQIVIATAPDDTDDIYVAYGSNGTASGLALRRYSWSGTDVTHQAAQGAGSYNQPRAVALAILEDPDDATRYSCLVSFVQNGGNHYVQEFRAHKTTKTTLAVGDTVSNFTGSDNTATIWPFDTATPYQPSGAEMFVTADSSGTLVVYRVFHNGTIWTSSSTAVTPASWGIAQYAVAGFYDPNDGYMYWSIMIGSDHLEICRQTPASWNSTWTKRSNSGTYPRIQYGSYVGGSYSHSLDKFAFLATDSGNDFWDTIEYDPSTDTWTSWTEQYDGTLDVIVSASGSYYHGDLWLLPISDIDYTYGVEFWLYEAGPTTVDFVGWGIPIGVA